MNGVRNPAFDKLWSRRRADITRYISNQSAPPDSTSLFKPPREQPLPLLELSPGTLSLAILAFLSSFKAISLLPFGTLSQLSMAPKVIKNIRSYAASVFRPPVDRVDNDRYTVCWNCFVRNYKRHNGHCFNCGILM